MPQGPKRSFNVNSKTITMPLAAFTMACLLFVYTRQSIHAAKMNARKHREADGGQISWHNETLRRHGQLERPEHGDMSSMKGLFSTSQAGVEEAKEKAKAIAESEGKSLSAVGQTESDRLVRERALRR